ncbi:casein kinase substrate phosphoprotein PP28-domain-containing protein [Rhizoctonia solani]|nr:casein kinase substrate phosphoprotein PP28-domain-containing protein [Rhizoctonia solani]
MVRGTGKFKQKRGGGRSFSRDMVLDSDGVASGTDRRASRRKKQEEEGDDDDEEESGEEEEEEEDEEEESDDAGPSETAQPEMSRAERKALKKQKGKGIGTIKEGSGEGSEDDSDLINPNHVQMKNLSISDMGAPRELSRREREAKEKKEAEQRYWQLHMSGKTDKAKSDMARLAKIRAEREAAAAKRKQEAEERTAEAEKKAAERQSRR